MYETFHISLHIGNTAIQSCMIRALRIPDKICHLTRQSMRNRGKVAIFYLSSAFRITVYQFVQFPALDLSFVMLCDRGVHFFSQTAMRYPVKD